MRFFSSIIITKICIACTVIGFIVSPTTMLSQEDKILQELHETIKVAPIYDAAKKKQIDSLRNKLFQLKPGELDSRYNLNKELRNEYRVFEQDSAFVYGLRTKELAEVLGQEYRVAEAIIDLGDISVSAGMYKEALDFLREIDPDEIPENIRSLYYGLLGRCYSEMAEYSNLPYFSSGYNHLAAEYRRAALELTEEGTFFNSFLEGFMEYRGGDIQEALGVFRELEKQELSLRDKALVHYLLGDLYFQLEERDSAITHFAHSAMADIKTSTKENLAFIRLAELLFEKGDFRNASLFVQKANDDASFYGAQQRKIRVGAILPLIEEQVVRRIEEQRSRLYRQNIIMSLLLIFVVALAGVIYLQVRKLGRAKKIIEKAHNELQHTNRQILEINNKLNETNEKLKETNQEVKRVNNQLLEANKIKEEYIGFFFSQDADIFEKFRDFKIKVEESLKEDNISKVKYLVSSYNLKKEKEKLLQNFDEAFIKLFPNFIEEFNSLLKPEERIKIKRDQILNKELRIFALIRLGITHNEIIAQILGYSVNSIYAYKTKIRNKSILDKKEFDDNLLQNTTLRL